MSELGSHNGDGIRFRMYLSAPKGGVAQMLRDPAGDWVTYDEYASLKAEVERLRASSFVTAVPVEQYERVVKAGDLLCFHYISLARKRWPDDPLPSSVTAWNAAKEGKPSV